MITLTKKRLEIISTLFYKFKDATKNIESSLIENEFSIKHTLNESYIVFCGRKGYMFKLSASYTFYLVNLNNEKLIIDYMKWLFIQPKNNYRGHFDLTNYDL